MPRITRPISIAMLPHQLQKIDAAAARAGYNRSQFINRVVDETLRGTVMLNSKNGVVPSTDVSEYGNPSNRIGVRGYPGSVSTPTGKLTAKTQPGSAAPAVKANTATAADDPAKGTMPGQPKLRNSFR